MRAILRLQMSRPLRNKATNPTYSATSFYTFTVSMFPCAPDPTYDSGKSLRGSPAPYPRSAKTGALELDLGRLALNRVPQELAHSIA
jgi:hypothetical protein